MNENNKLKAKIKTLFEVDSDDLDRFINQHYGWAHDHFEFIPDQEMSNNTSKSYDFKKKNLDPTNILDRHQIEELKRFKSGKHESYIFQNIMQELVNNDILPEGEYLIKVFW